jgi:hypothetical protein
LGWVLGALIFLEFLVRPFPMLSAAVPAWSQRLAQEPYAGVLDVPMTRQDSEYYMLYQLTHGKGLVEGHVSRPPQKAYRFIYQVPLLAHLSDHSGYRPPTQPIHVTVQLRALHEAAIPYLVLHRPFGGAKFLTDYDIGLWRRFLVVDPIYEDGEVIVYTTDPAAHLQALDAFVEGRAAVAPLQARVSARQTIPGGWVELRVQWYAPPAAASSGSDLCLGLMGDDGRLAQQTCDYTLFGEPGAALAPGLMQMTYLFRVEPEVADGAYRLVFLHASAGDGAAPEPLGPMLAVQANPDRFTPPSPSRSMDVTFGGKIALVGYDLITDTPESLQLQLYWHAVARPAESYKVFVHLLDADTGSVAAQSDHVPVNWQYPTDIWAEGEYVQDPVSLDLSGVGSGRYDLLVGLYPAEGGERLTTAPAYANDAVLLTTMRR